MKILLSTNDYLIIIAYFIIILVIGFRTKKSDDTVKDYIVGGRMLTLPAFVATLVASFYGGVLGIGEFTYMYGISGWLLYAFPFYLFITFFAFFLADKIRKSHLYTIPDKLFRVYGKKVSIVGGILIFLLATPAPFLFMLGILIRLIFGFNMIYAMIIALLLSIMYLFKGGFRADVRVNIFEFILMFVGFGIILPFCFNTLGGTEYLDSRLPESYMTLFGGLNIQIFFVWFFIGSWVLIDPVFHQRCYAVKNKKTPKRGIIISLVFWIIFDFLTTAAGLYARAFINIDDIPSPLYSYPALAEQILPPIAKGFFFIGLIATVMSSLHSYIFVSATTFSKDIISRIKDNTSENVSYNRIGMIVSALFSLLLAYLIPSVVQIWYTIGTMIIPALLISVLSSYFVRYQVHSKYILMAMISSFTVSFIFFIIGNLNTVNGIASYPFNIEPMYPGLIIGLIIYLIGYNNRKYLKTVTD